MNVCKNLSGWEKCLALVAHGSDALHEGNLASAEASLQLALRLAQSTPPEQAHGLSALALCNLSVLRQRQGRIDDSQQLRTQAKARMDENAVSTQDALFQHLMAIVLMELGEYRRAIPFWEQAIHLESSSKDPVVIAHGLWRVGECYSRSGLKGHATIPLRAAARIFRNQAGDPRLPAVLVTLGNALRKTVPDEAESCYREAADLHVAKGHLQSATPSWVNLGVLCSEQGRYAESLDYYERVLRVREQSPGTPPSSIATVLNNTANAYRRMGKSAEAFRSVDRAIEILEVEGGAGLASAYGTRGLIFRDAGQDAEAVDWLRRAYSENQKLPSPNLATVAEDLENEIAALKRLGKPDEAAGAEERLGRVHAAMKVVPADIQYATTLDDSKQEAVFVELDVGYRTQKPFSKRDVAGFADKLADAVNIQNAGFYAGNAVIPESTTLLFYGDDAEALFQVLEPILASEAMCAGARVTIRRLTSHREVILPSQLT